MLKCPISERPREKAIHYGIESLSNQELLAVILRTGHKEMSVMNLAMYVLEEIGGFAHLKDVDYHQLIQIKGIKQAKAVEVLASIELARRMQEYHDSRYVIHDPFDGYHLVKNRLLFEQQEKVILLCLNAKLEVIYERILFIGSESVAMLEPKEVFQYTLRCGSSRMMLIHNHPSGNPQPSNEDRQITKRLTMMAQQLQIELIDHLIIGRHCFYSFASDQIYDCKGD